MWKVAILHAHVYLNNYLNGTYILCSYRVEVYMHLGTNCNYLWLYWLSIYVHTCIHVHYSFLYKVNDHITHSSVNYQHNWRHFSLSIKRIPIYLKTQKMPSNSLQKLKYVFTFFINYYLYLQLTLHWKKRARRNPASLLQFFHHIKPHTNMSTPNSQGLSTAMTVISANIEGLYNCKSFHAINYV